MKPHKYGFFLQRDERGCVSLNRDGRRLLERCYKIRQHGWHRKFLPDEQKTIYVKTL